MTSDLCKYFRNEARELVQGLTQGVLELERGTGDARMVTNLLRLAHTLKGASRVVKQPAIAELAHRVEDMLAPLREAEPQLTRQQAGGLLQTLDDISARVAALNDERSNKGGPAVCANTEEFPQTVRVELEEVDRLLRNLAEVGSQITTFEEESEAARQVHRLAGLVTRQLGSGTMNDPSALKAADNLLQLTQRLQVGLASAAERVRREFDQTHESAKCLRLLPAAALFPAVIRAVRDAATTLGKRVQVDTICRDIRLDAPVLAVMRDALLHLVRNAVAHGIEDEGTRTAAGKAACGSIVLAIERRGNTVIFRCKDDGAGIDVEAVRRVAVKQGVVSPAASASLDVSQVISLILRGGVSTSETINGISGRGIGLDVVREAVKRLKGEISVDTAAGRGTTVEISVPVSLMSIAALVVESAGSCASIPLDSVRRAVRLAAEDIVESGRQQSIIYEGRSIPFVELAAAMDQQPPASAGRRHACAVITSAGAGAVAVGVDRVLRTETLLVQSVPALLAPTEVVAGISIDRSGNPQIVLAPEGLLAAVSAGPVSGSPPVRRAPILIVDDSLTTRLVEQGILESAGYQVETAASGEEAIEKAHARAYSLFLVDIEMPGMDGFELISRIGEDADLRGIPSILVTSRSSAEDRRRGAQAGARAYIVKSEFDQRQFLRTVEQLIQAAA